MNAYDGRVNIWWEKCVAGDFDHYNIYLNKAEIADVTGINVAQQIKDVAVCRYQATGLDNGTSYYFAVTAVDKSCNEDVQVSSVSATPVLMPRGTKDPNLNVDIYQPDRVYAGTTLLPLNYNPTRHRIVEFNMLGEIIWEFVIPETSGFAEAELLLNNNILYTMSGKGVFEIDRSGKIVWSYLTNKADHDADRLPNGNTIFVFGFDDQKSDAQVVEVNPTGRVVWTWYARDHFNKPPYNNIFDQGWTHSNAVSRLPNGNTLISLRNFDLVAEVDPKGEVVRTYGEGIFTYQHDPEMLPNGNIIATNPGRSRPHRAIELNSKDGKIVWQYLVPGQNKWPVRDANRLPNGNTIVTGSTEIVEVTAEGEIVWRLKLQDISFSKEFSSQNGFYKADRISTQRY